MPLMKYVLGPALALLALFSAGGELLGVLEKGQSRLSLGIFFVVKSLWCSIHSARARYVLHAYALLEVGCLGGTSDIRHQTMQ